MGTCQGCRALTQIPARKQSSIAERSASIEQEDIEVARQLHVLEAIVKHNDLYAKAFDGKHPSSVTVPSYQHWDSG
jgi:hypothetical protein